MPERFRGTVVENWLRYWRGLTSDYAEVVRDTATSVRQRPGKATLYATAIGFVGAAMKKNPSENAFRARVIEARDEVKSKFFLIGERTRSKAP